MTLTTFHLKGIENKQSSQFMKPLYIWSRKDYGKKQSSLFMTLTALRWKDMGKKLSLLSWESKK